jgi:hypothetical protein
MERRNTSYGGDDYEGILLRSYGKTKVTWAAMMLISQLYILLQHSRSTRCFIDEKSYYFVAMLGKDSCGMAWCLQLQLVSTTNALLWHGLSYRRSFRRTGSNAGKLKHVWYFGTSSYWIFSVLPFRCHPMQIHPQMTTISPHTSTQASYFCARLKRTPRSGPRSLSPGIWSKTLSRTNPRHIVVFGEIREVFI